MSGSVKIGNGWKVEVEDNKESEVWRNLVFSKHKRSFFFLIQDRIWSLSCGKVGVKTSKKGMGICFF